MTPPRPVLPRRPAAPPGGGEPVRAFGPVNLAVVLAELRRRAAARPLTPTKEHHEPH